jgi:hypothetical protein
MDPPVEPEDDDIEFDVYALRSWKDGRTLDTRSSVLKRPLSKMSR